MNTVGSIELTNERIILNGLKDVVAAWLIPKIPGIKPKSSY